MASENNSSFEHCVLNPNAINISTLVYAGISFLSFLLLVPTVVLSVIIYFKRKVVMEHMEGLFLTLAVIMLSLSFNESFQWVLFCSSVGCEVVGFIREFCLISLLSNTSCIGFHLLLQMCQPKCLHVIDEVRRRRSRILAVVYLILVILIPLLFVFWPFFKNGKYGNDSSFCWISNEFHSPWYIRILLWHIWALLICAFTLLVSLLVVARLCLRAAKCNADIFTLLLLMIGFLYAVVVFGLSAVLGNSSYLPSAGSLAFMFSGVALISRSGYNICYKRPYGLQVAKASRSIYKATRSMTSSTPLVGTPYAAPAFVDDA